MVDRWLRLGVITVALVLVVSGGALLMVPEVARRVAADRLEARLGAPVRIDDVDLNLFTRRGAVEGMSVGDSSETAPPAVRLDHLAFRFSLRALTRGEIALSEVVLANPVLRVERSAGGFVLPGIPLASTPERSGAASPLTIGTLRVESGVLELRDRSRTPATSVRVEGIDVSVRGLDLGTGSAPAVVSGAAQVAEGRIRIDGSLRPTPFQAQLDLVATALPLRGLGPYLPRDVELTHGRLGATLNLRARWGGEAGPAVETTGTLELDQLELTLADDDARLLQVGHATVGLARLSLLPGVEVEVEQIRLVRVHARVERAADGTVALRRLWADDSAGAGTRDGPPQPSGRRSIAVNRIEITDSRVEFHDEAMSRPFTSVLSDLALEVRDLRPDVERAPLTISGHVDGTPLDLSGWLALFGDPATVHLEGTLRAYELSRLGPYAERYLGYRIQRGQVTTEVEYTHQVGAFDSETDLRLRRVKLGERVDDTFRRRVGIPLGLALALLEDVRGDVRLRLPISSDPERGGFQVADAIWAAVRNTLARALVAPFKVLGAVLTAGGRIGALTVDPVTFQPGSAALDDTGAERIRQIATLLKQRPRLELGLEGQVGREEGDALRRARLRDRVARLDAPTYEEGLRRLYRAAGSGAGPRTADVSIEEMEQALLRRMPADGEALRALGDHRARAVKDRLLAAGLEPGRVFYAGEPELVDGDRGRVVFDLSG